MFMFTDKKVNRFWYKRHPIERNRATAVISAYSTSSRNERFLRNYVRKGQK